MSIKGLTAGLIAAAAGTGIKAFADNRARKQVAQDTAAVQRQQLLDQTALAKQTEIYRSQQQQAQQAMTDRANAMFEQKQKAAASMTPLQDQGLKGLQTIATSPLGDLSEPVLGRKKLLGN